jgi:hypothetical protein
MELIAGSLKIGKPKPAPWQPILVYLLHSSSAISWYLLNKALEIPIPTAAFASMCRVWKPDPQGYGFLDILRSNICWLQLPRSID